MAMQLQFLTKRKKEIIYAADLLKNIREVEKTFIQFFLRSWNFCTSVYIIYKIHSYVLSILL